MRELRAIARRHQMSVGEWVRQTLRAARTREPLVDAAKKLRAVRRAAEYSFPVADVETMIAEIEQGYRQ